MTNITIHSNGIDGVVVDSEGKKLEGVSEVTIWLEANDVTRADITVRAARVNVVARLQETTLVCPVCHEEHTHSCTPDTLSGT